MRNRLSVLLLFGLLASCATRVSKPVEPVSNSEFFPDGQYFQVVQVKVKLDKETRDFDFNAVIKKDQKNLIMKGLNGFGFSMFSLEDDGQNLKFSTSINEVEKNKEFFMKIYPIIRKVVYLQKNDRDLQNNNLIFTVDNVKNEIFLEKFDEAGVPTHISVRGGGRVDVKVETTKYRISQIPAEKIP